LTELNYLRGLHATELPFRRRV